MYNPVSSFVDDNDILIVIVIYKCELEYSKTFTSLKNSLGDVLDIQKKINIYIYDNSPIAQKVLEYKGLRIDYVHDPSNSGISKAYNSAANFAWELNKRWLILFDQDTSISYGAIDAYKDAFIKYNEIKLFSPLLYSKGTIISPSVFKYRKGRPPKNHPITGINSLKELSPLNSGMAIKLDEFLEIGGYNESVPLDYSDFAFIDRFKKYNNSFVILNLKLEHGLSSYEKVPIDISIKRYKSLCIGLVNSSNGKLNLLLSFFVALQRCVKLTIEYKEINYIKILYAEFINRS